MAKYFVIFGILILRLYVNALHSDISKLEYNATKEKTAPKLDDAPISIENENNGTLEQTVHQKTFYDFYGYRFLPINPVIYPSYGKTDKSVDTGVFGASDPLHQIHQQLQKVIVKRPHPPPSSPARITIFYPLIYVAQSCICNSSTNINTTTQETPKPIETTKPPIPTETKHITNPDVTLKLPDLEDEDNESEFEDNNIPISFDPRGINTKLTRPPPPVEHGSSQAGGPDNNPTTTKNSESD